MLCCSPNFCPHQDPPLIELRVPRSTESGRSLIITPASPRSLAVKLNRVHLDRDGASSVATALLLRLLVPEGFAFGEL